MARRNTVTVTVTYCAAMSACQKALRFLLSLFVLIY